MQDIVFPLVPADYIRWKSIDGLVYLLDLRSESYFAFDEVASFLWVAAHDCPSREALEDALLAQYAVDRGVAESDLNQFLEDCRMRGLTFSEPSQSTGIRTLPRHRRLLTLHAWFSLLRTAFSLRATGFSQSYSRLAELRPAKTASAEMDTIVARGRTAFQRAESLFLFRRAPDDCVPRSMALYRYLLGLGVPVEHCIGIQRYPFSAHAWVEYRSVALDSDQQHEQFTVLARLKASNGEASST